MTVKYKSKDELDKQFYNKKQEWDSLANAPLLKLSGCDVKDYDAGKSHQAIIDLFEYVRILNNELDYINGQREVMRQFLGLGKNNEKIY